MGAGASQQDQFDQDSTGGDQRVRDSTDAETRVRDSTGAETRVRDSTGAETKTDGGDGIYNEESTQRSNSPGRGRIMRAYSTPEMETPCTRLRRMNARRVALHRHGQRTQLHQQVQELHTFVVPTSTNSMCAPGTRSTTDGRGEVRRQPPPTNTQEVDQRYVTPPEETREERVRRLANKRRAMKRMSDRRLGDQHASARMDAREQEDSVVGEGVIQHATQAPRNCAQLQRQPPMCTPELDARYATPPDEDPAARARRMANKRTARYRMEARRDVRARQEVRIGSDRDAHVIVNDESTTDENYSVVDVELLRIRGVSSVNEGRVRTRRTLNRNLFLEAFRDDDSLQRHQLGRMEILCQHCSAKMWIEERKSSSSKSSPSFELCCGQGKIRLQPLPPVPPVLLDLLTRTDAMGRHFCENVRAYNSALSFTSSGAKLDKRYANNTSGVYTYRIQGGVYHKMSSFVLPETGEQPKFAQIYIYDTDYQLQRRTDVFRDLNEGILRDLQQMLEDAANPFVQQFRSLSAEAIRDQQTQNFSLQIVQARNDDDRYRLPVGSEVAAILPGDGSTSTSGGDRQIVLHKRGGELQFIKQWDSRYDPLHYVLLFPHGHHGWNPDIRIPRKVTANQFYRYRLMVREDPTLIQLGGRLTQEYVVDMYAKVEEGRLRWNKNNQDTLHAHLYQDHSGNTGGQRKGKLIVLPSSFTGGPRYMQQLYQDAMAIVRKRGKPDYFITMTCNPKWPEIQAELLPGQKAQDRFDLCCRVFRLKLKVLTDALYKKNVFGRVIGRVMVVEFQKRGLPHAHILLIIHPDDKPKTVEDIDRVISAELPDENDAMLYNTVTKHMLHGVCGDLNPSAPCMEKGVCSKNFPKDFQEFTAIGNDSYPMYRRRDNGSIFQKGGFTYNNCHVVPHNKYLCRLLDCHINVEICSSIKAVKYLYKYVYKGHDRVEAEVSEESNPNADDTSRENDSVSPAIIDEAKQFLDARYISASESFWRICEFPMQKMYPSVTQLHVHEEGKQTVYTRDNDDSETLAENAEKTTLTEWMTYNRTAKTDTVAKTVLYCDFPSHYTWNNTSKVWSPRQSVDSIGRVYFVNPRDTERYYLRVLLHHVPGATCFEDLRTFENTTYPTFHAAVKARGLLADDEEFDRDMETAAVSCMPSQLRQLFVTMLLFCELAEPRRLFDKHLDQLTEDYRHVLGINDVTDDVLNMALGDIERLLNEGGSSLRDFADMPSYDDSAMNPLHEGNDFSHNFGSCSTQALSATIAELLNPDQKALFDAVIASIHSEATEAKCFYVDGPGGSGKTFTYSAIIAHLKSKHIPFIATATTGIAALLMEDGRTYHSTFKIPIPCFDYSTCDIPLQSKLARRIRETKLIIVDEAPMMAKHVYEALDRTLRDIMKDECASLGSIPFGGKTILMGGDFRQMLPVLLKSRRSQIVNVCLNRSYLWPSFRVFKLTKNMRVVQGQEDWAKKLLDIGEGHLVGDIPIPYGIKRTTLMDQLIHRVYGTLGPETDFSQKAILTPLNKDVNLLNDAVLDKFPGSLREYSSIDEIPDGDASTIHLYPTEFLNTIEMASLPLHKLRLKEGCVVILIRNINPALGLCNGTKLIIERFHPTLLRVRVASQGAFFGSVHYLPRVRLYPSEVKFPVQFRRTQFPIRLAFAITVNKSQGQTLQNIGLYLPNPFFAHGHLYVTLSRTKCGPSGIVLMTSEPNQNTINNVVYTEVFQTH